MEQEAINPEDIEKIKTDLEIIKSILLCHRNNKDPEGELSAWANQELEEARNESEESYTSFEDLKKEIEDDL